MMINFLSKTSGSKFDRIEKKLALVNPLVVISYWFWSSQLPNDCQATDSSLAIFSVIVTEPTIILTSQHDQNSTGLRNMRFGKAR